MMGKFIFFISILFSLALWGKPIENADSYQCPAKGKQLPVPPVFLTQLKDKFVIGICGKKEVEIKNYSDFDIIVFPPTKKPLFANHEKNKKFLIIEKKDGLVLIEKVKVDKEFVELFRHDFICDNEKCKVANEVCIPVNNVKQKWIAEKLKDRKVKKTD